METATKRAPRERRVESKANVEGELVARRYLAFWSKSDPLIVAHVHFCRRSTWPLFLSPYGFRLSVLPSQLGSQVTTWPCISPLETGNDNQLSLNLDPQLQVACVLERKALEAYES